MRIICYMIWLEIKLLLAFANSIARPRYFNPLSGNAPYFIILLCLTSDNFTRQEENLPLNGLIRRHPVYPVSGNVPRCALLYYFTLSYA